jgi:hypothetical protein
MDAEDAQVLTDVRPTRPTLVTGPVDEVKSRPPRARRARPTGARAVRDHDAGHL